MPDYNMPAASNPSVPAPGDLTPQQVATPQSPSSASIAPKDFSQHVSEVPDAPMGKQFLIDTVANKTVEVPNDHVPEMVASGAYALPPVGKQYAMDSDGSLVQVENTHYAAALRSGVVTPASDEDVRKEIYKQQYGDSELKAAAYAAARGLSMGVSDVAFAHGDPAKKAELAGLQSANPWVSGIVEGAGTVVGMFIPTGPVAEVGKLGAAAVSITERATEKMLAKGAVEAGLSKSVAKSIIAKHAPDVAGLLVEGSLYSTGGLVSEAALGKADFNAENLAGSMGVGAILGVGLGVGGAAVKELFPVAKGLASKLTGISEDFANPSKNAAEVMGMTPLQSSKAVQRDAKFFDKTVNAMRDSEKIGYKYGDSAEVLGEKVEAFHENAGKRIGAAIDDIREQASTNPDIMPESKAIYGRLRKESATFAKELEAEPGIAAPANAADHKMAKQWEKTYAELEASVKPGQRMDIDTLQRMRQELDAASKWDITKNIDPAKIAIAKELRGSLRSEIDTLADRAAISSGDGTVGSRLKDANADYYLGSKLNDIMQRKLAKNNGHGFNFKDLILGDIAEHVTGSGLITGAILGVKKLMQSDLKRQMVILGGIEKANMAINKALDSSTAKFFTNSAEKIAPSLRNNTVAKLNEFSLAKSDNGKSPSNTAQAYKNIQQNLSHYASNPERLINTIGASTANMTNAAPNTKAALAMVGSNAVNFLNNKLPRKINSPGMLERPYTPSGTELAKFERYLTAVEKPIEVVKNFADGKMSREEAEALKAVYPDMFSRLQEKAMTFVGANPHLPYNKKLQLGVLLDIATDPSLQPRNIMGLQSNFSNQQPQMAQGEASGAAPNQKGLQNLSFDSRIEGTEEN